MTALERHEYDPVKAQRIVRHDRLDDEDARPPVLLVVANLDGIAAITRSLELSPLGGMFFVHGRLDEYNKATGLSLIEDRERRLVNGILVLKYV